MKRILRILTILLCFTMLIGTVGCSQNNNGDSVNQLTYGKKYIYSGVTTLPDNQSQYYIFYADGSGIKYHYETFSGYVDHYTMNFKYYVMDDGVLCYFYDSATIHSDDNVSDPEEFKDDCGTLLFSKNVVSTRSGMLYVMEDYLDEIPNFG